VNTSMSGGALVVGHGSSFVEGGSNIYGATTTPHGTTMAAAGGGISQSSHVCCGMSSTHGSVEASGSAMQGHHVSAAQSFVSSSASSMTMGWAGASSSSGGYAGASAN